MPYCTHDGIVFTGEMSGTHYVYKCLACGVSVWSDRRPDKEGNPTEAETCAHSNAIVKIEGTRKTECGCKVPNRVAYCPDCGKEYSVV